MEFSKLAKIKANGVPLCMAENLRYQVMSGDIPVTTLCGGEVGYTNGAQHLEASWDNAIPEAGFENYFVANAAAHTTITLMFEMGGKTITARGRILSTSLSSSTNAANNMGASFRGVLLSIA